MSFQPNNTKILYLTDSYAQQVAGIKISIFNEIKRRGYNITKANIHSAGKGKIDGKNLLVDLRREKYTHLWVAHTWVSYAGCTLADINKAKVKVLGFGFSDPYRWKDSKLNLYNHYATHSRILADKVKKKPILYLPNSCDLSFHKDLKLPKSTDVLFIGCGVHPQFKDKNYRIKLMKVIQRVFPNTKVFGRHWPGIKSNPPITGDKFLKEINKAKIGLDLEQLNSPLAHRNFEFPACGVPIITRKRYDVFDAFTDKQDVLLYDNIKDLVSTIKKLLANDKYYSEYKKRMYKSVIENHTIKNRMDKLLNWLDQL